MDWRTANPGAGKPRKDIKPGYYCFPEGRRLILYIMTDGIVDVVGSPLQGIDIAHHSIEWIRGRTWHLVLTPGIQLVLTTPTQLTGLSNAWALLLKIQLSIRLMDITQQPHYCAQQRFNKA